MLDYAALSALAAVVREGSFERAARALHVTPSAVSQRIRLAGRTGGLRAGGARPALPATDTGRRLCQHADRVRLLEQELQGTLPQLAPEGLARVALPIAVNADSLATWFAPAVAAFAADAPVLVDWRSTTRTTPPLAAQRRRAGRRDRHGPPGRGLQQPAAGRDALHRRRQPGLHGAPLCRRRGAGSLAQAPSLVFNAKDALQARWVRRPVPPHVELPRHTLPSPRPSSPPR
jgi:LysR family transcriptional regulator (chromosome initiation inhibitor)